MSTSGAFPLRAALRVACAILAAAALLVPAAQAERSRSDVRPPQGAPSARPAPSPSPPSSTPAPPAVRGGSGGSTPRVAVPRGDAPSRSPQVRRPRPDDDRYGHRPHYRGYYPYYGYWDPYYSSYWNSPYYGYWGWRSWWGLGWYGGPLYGPGYGTGSGYRPGYAGSSGRAGALDLDVWPEEAEVWIDGERMGEADDFDGFPTYLWLPPGTYDLVIYHEGYRTIARQVTIRTGELVDVEDEMDEGEAIRPQDLGPPTTVRRDARLERDRERIEDVERRRFEQERREEAWHEREERDESWRQRRGEIAEEDIEPGEWAAETPSAPARERAGWLRLRVEPEDASVYLDGTFLGSAADLAEGGVVVEPGEHRVEVVRPGYQGEDETFEVEPGEEVELRLELDD